MKRSIVLLIIAVLFTFTGAIAQEKQSFTPPDYTAIRKATKDPGSPYYYPNLMKRYRSNDTTFTLEEFRMLYFGYLYQPGFSASGLSSYNDSVTRILNKPGTLTATDYQDLIRFENRILDEYPFNMKDLNALGYALEKTGNPSTARLAGYKLDRVARLILSTGDGKTAETAWHVIAVGHEYDILTMLGFLFGGQQELTEGSCDYLTVKENPFGVKGLYFNVLELIQAETRSKEKQIRGTGNN